MKLFNVMDTSFDRFDETIRRYPQKTFNNLGLEYTLCFRIAVNMFCSVNASSI